MKEKYERLYLNVLNILDKSILKTEYHKRSEKFIFTIVNGETLRNYFLFLPAYSLIMWLMRTTKNFEKKHTF